MKSVFSSLFIVILPFVLRAETRRLPPIQDRETFIGTSDRYHAKFSKVEKIQLVIGGPKEDFMGVTDKNAVRRLFQINIPGFYKCYADAFGSKQVTGESVFQFDLAVLQESEAAKDGAVKPTKIRVQSSNLKSELFNGCVMSFLSSIKMPAPNPGATVTVTMPIEAKLRN